MASHMTHNPCSRNRCKEEYGKLSVVSSDIGTFNPNSKLFFLSWRNSRVFLLLLALGNRQNIFSSLKDRLVCCSNNWIIQSKIPWMLQGWCGLFLARKTVFCSTETTTLEVIASLYIFNLSEGKCWDLSLVIGVAF